MRLDRGATWVPPTPLAADESASGWVCERAAELRGVVDLGILSPEENGGSSRQRPPGSTW